MQDDFRPFRPKAPEPAFVPVPVEETPYYDQPAMTDTDDPGVDLPAPHPQAAHQSRPPKGHKWNPKTWVRWFKRQSRNKKFAILGALAGLLIAVGGLTWFYVLRDKPAPPPPPAPAVKEEEPPKPTTLPSPLTGVQVQPELAQLPVTGVMIENSPDARPQSSLYDAGVVFEAIAEGGITRFLALFQEAKPARIGPVRSVRPYYLDFLAPFDAPIAHAGGSGQALAMIRNEKFKDIDHGANASTYQRVSSRYAPHNLYTSRDKLLAVHAAKGWNTSSFTGFARKEEAKSPTPNAGQIRMTISGALYNVGFDYDPATNSYKRFLAGAPHVDEGAKKQINPKVVIGLVMSHRYAGIYSVYGTTGSGSAYFFQDGVGAKGTWEKAGRKSQFVFKDASGQIQKLNPGQTWITIVSNPGAVTYK